MLNELLLMTKRRKRRRRRWKKTKKKMIMMKKMKRMTKSSSMVMKDEEERMGWSHLEAINLHKHKRVQRPSVGDCYATDDRMVPFSSVAQQMIQRNPATAHPRKTKSRHN